MDTKEDFLHWNYCCLQDIIHYSSAMDAQHYSKIHKVAHCFVVHSRKSFDIFRMFGRRIFPNIVLRVLMNCSQYIWEEFDGNIIGERSNESEMKKWGLISFPCTQANLRWRDESKMKDFTSPTRVDGGKVKRAVERNNDKLDDCDMMS